MNTEKVPNDILFCGVREIKEARSMQIRIEVKGCLHLLRPVEVSAQLLTVLWVA